MIGHLEGVVRAVRGTYCVISVGGVGYKVGATKDTLASLTEGGSAALWTYHAVREDAQDLYGFPLESELRFFELLLTVSGIGPKSALGILDAVSIETLRSAIVHGKSEYLTKISGIGKKTGEKIILELREKVGAGIEGVKEMIKGDEEALEAMRALGYTVQEAREALRQVPAHIESSKDRLREAIKLLGTNA